ncbi:MAG: TolC family protein [Betaproteobacteria bacterium]|nr:TolC family protein [Betaproteobacteria bacterium]
MTKAAVVWLVMASVAAPLWAGQSSGVVDKEPAGQESVAVITLDQLTQVVLNHNHVLRAAQWGVYGAKAGVKTASALLNPKVELQQGQWQPSALNRQSVRAWSIAQPLENPTVRSARIQAAESGLVVSGQQLAMAKNDLAAQVRTRAYETLLYQSEAETAAETLALLQQVRERIRVRVATGEAARYELIKADAEVIHARERQQSSQLLAQQAWLDINRLAAGQLPMRWKLAATFHDDVEAADLVQLQAQADQNNPELISLKHELERAQAQLRLVQAGRWPGVELRYGENQEPNLRQTTWGVVVQLPLLDQRTGPVAEAQAEVDRIKTRLEGRRNELQQQVVLAWRSLEMARLRVEALGQGVVREAEAALRVAQAAYQFGERGILDVLDAQRVLRGVRSDLLQARYQLHAARIALDQLAGRFAHAS